MIIISASISISACSKEKHYGNEYTENEDSQYMFKNLMLENSIAESDKGYYFIEGNYIYYADKPTMKPVPLCNKAECLHDKETDPKKTYKCDAFVDVNIMNRFITVYENRLYVYMDSDYHNNKLKPQLVSMSLDGSDKKTVITFNGQVSHITLHRGSIYYSYVPNENNEYQVLRYNLKQNENELVYESKAQGGQISTIDAYGNKIYFIESIFTNSNTNEKLFEYDCLKNTKREVPKDKESIAIGTPCVFNNRVYYKQWYGDKEANKNKQIFSMNFDGKDIKIDNHEERGTIYSDDKYFYQDNFSDVLDKNAKRKLTIYSKINSKIAEVEFSKIPNNSNIIVGDKNYMFIEFKKDDKQYIKVISKEDLIKGEENIKDFFEIDNKYLYVGIDYYPQ